VEFVYRLGERREQSVRGGTLDALHLVATVRNARAFGVAAVGREIRSRFSLSLSLCLSPSVSFSLYLSLSVCVSLSFFLLLYERTTRVPFSFIHSLHTCQRRSDRLSTSEGAVGRASCRKNMSRCTIKR